MVEALFEVFGSAAFVPHAVCLLWRPDLLVMHGASDLLIAMAYLTIPIVIVKAARTRPDLLDTNVAKMFAAFITACALSHLAGFLTLWFPYYGLQGVIKVATAGVSLYTAYQLARMLPEFLALPSRQQMALKEAELILKVREAEESEKTNRKLEEFAYLAAHDLRAPLRALKAIPDWLHEELNNPESDKPEINHHVDLLKSQVERMDALVVDLLEYSKIGNSDAVCETVKIEETIHRVVRLLDPPAGFEITITGTLPPLRVMRPEFELVVRNLIGNAIKHHDRDTGTIIVRGLGWDGDMVQLEFEDDGPGIPEKHFSRIFEKFSRLRRRDEVEGSGMGLAMVTRAIESAGGAISVRNGEDGRGAIFRVSLPNRSSHISTK